MFTVYILKSAVVVKSYVGVTDNIERRLKEHNSGKSYYTKKYTPWNVVYTEKFELFSEARKREKYFKSASGRRQLKKIFATISK